MGTLILNVPIVLLCKSVTRGCLFTSVLLPTVALTHLHSGPLRFCHSDSMRSGPEGGGLAQTRHSAAAGMHQGQGSAREARAGSWQCTEGRVLCLNSQSVVECIGGEGGRGIVDEVVPGWETAAGGGRDSIRRSGWWWVLVLDGGSAGQQAGLN